MKCEIINPSDEVFIEHDDSKTLFKAVIMLGQGWYGIQEVGGDFEIPVLALGGAEKFCQEKFGINLALVSKSVRNEELVKAFRSVHMGHERSSLNDIVGSAHSIADQLEKKMKAARA